MFADLFKATTPSHADGSCHYFKPSDDPILDIEEEDMDKVADLWGHCLLGCFAGKFPRLKAVRYLVDKWNTQCEILPHQSGWVLFQFKSKTELERILATGPYFIYGRTLLLRTLPEDFSFQDEDYNIVPTRVELHNLPLQCWNTRAISRIASKLGKPLCIDNITLERRKISYARVLIEMDTSVKPLESFEVRLPSGVIYNQYVHYENCPKFCNHCYMFGHLWENCRHLKQPVPETNSVPLEKTTTVPEDTRSKPLEKKNVNSDTSFVGEGSKLPVSIHTNDVPENSSEA